MTNRTRSKKKKKKNGFILLDVIITMFIAAVALVSVLGGIAGASRAIGRSALRIEKSIEDRNEWELEDRIEEKIQ